jgi:hypothetical protein
LPNGAQFLDFGAQFLHFGAQFLNLQPELLQPLADVIFARGAGLTLVSRNESRR